MDRFAFEKKLLKLGVRRLAGVDEAGRGPLAGPVVAAAVILPMEWILQGLPVALRGLNDSKQLTPEQRDAFFLALTTDPSVRFVAASVDSVAIDSSNILRATHRAMNEAVSRLSPEYVLVDGLRVASLLVPQWAVVRGDELSYSIAAASVIAKVTRDRMMLEFDRQFPAYGFADHKGYGTPEHLSAVARHGACPIHRLSFSPFRPTQLDLFD